ncbi:MAG: divalent-cation tolerance protein CutA [Pirellula sp.]
MKVPLAAICEISTTLPSQADAERIASELIDRKLAACVQITGPIQSVYFWQGDVHRDSEFSLRIKSCENRLVELLNFLRSQHPYELPEITWKILNASDEYAAWVAGICNH